MNWIQRFLTAITTHKDDANAHHTPPGDGDLAPKAHKDTHDPQDGSDPLDAAAPVKVGAANAEGSSHSLARADHVHEREHAKTTAGELNLADLAEKAHGSLTGVTSDQHHPQSHNAASHNDIASSGANIDDAVAKKHAQAHTLASHSTKGHTELTGVTSDQHHAQSHKDRHDPIDGADKLDTAAPVKVAAANAIGSSHSLSRADHVHEREHAKYLDSEAKAAAVQSGAIINGVTKAPTHDAVYDVKTTADYATTPAEAKAQAEGAKLDDHATPDDNTDLNATAAKHGLMPKASVTKLAAIAAGADVTGSNPPQAHKDSHDPNDGSDKLDTAAPVKIGEANAIGSSHSLSRADHVHEREHAKYLDSEAKAAAVQSGVITNGVTKAPTHDAVFDVKQTADIATTPGEVDAKITTHETGGKHRWTDEKLLKGAGPGADPDEVDMPISGPSMALDDTQVSHLGNVMTLKKTFTLVKLSGHGTIKITTSMKSGDTSLAWMYIKINGDLKTSHSNDTTSYVEFTDWIDISAEDDGNLTVEIWLKAYAGTKYSYNKLVEAYMGATYT